MAVGQMTMSQSFFSIRQPCLYWWQRRVIEKPCHACRAAWNRAPPQNSHRPHPCWRRWLPPAPGRRRRGRTACGGLPGDLYVRIRARTKSLPRGMTYIARCRFRSTSPLGGDIEVLTINGKVNMTIPAGTQTGAELRPKDAASPPEQRTPTRRPIRQGDRKCPPTCPATKRKLQAFAEACTDNIHPRLKAFIEKAKRFFK